MISKRILILTLFLPGVLLYAIPKTLVQSLENWPAGYDTTGKHWVVYNLNQAETHFVTENSVSSQTTTSLWMAQIGNFNGGADPWESGDTLIALGSIDTAYMNNPAGYGDNLNHCGFYWLFSDTINSVTPEFWQPADTIRPLPKPIVSKTGPGGGANDTIWIKIPNPKETHHTGQTEYDILGYWIWADSTGTGTPNAFNDILALELDFIPVDGVYGDTTVYWMLESEGFEGWATWTVYFAYKLVARPDTTSFESPGSPGHTTYYFSQNSDPIDVYQNTIGIEENLDSEQEFINFMISPNPFREKVNIVLGAEDIGQRVELKIYDSSGRVVKTFSLPTAYSLVPTVISWDGTDDSGYSVPGGIYFVQLEASGYKKTEKVILLR